MRQTEAPCNCRGVWGWGGGACEEGPQRMEEQHATQLGLKNKNRPTKEEFEDARKMDEQGPGNMGEGTARRKDQKEHVAT